MKKIDVKITKKDWDYLRLADSYLRNQVDPQKSIPLDYLSSLNVEDLDAITEDMFEYTTYTKENIRFIIKGVSKLLQKIEDNAIKQDKL